MSSDEKGYSCKGFLLLAPFCYFGHVGSQDFLSLCLLLFVAVAMQLFGSVFNVPTSQSPVPDCSLRSPVHSTDRGAGPAFFPDSLCGRAWTKGWPHTRRAVKLRPEEMLLSVILGWIFFQYWCSYSAGNSSCRLLTFQFFTTEVTLRIILTFIPFKFFNNDSVWTLYTLSLDLTPI